jgi:hypothetical protein
VALFGDYDPEGVRVVEDPYYGSIRDFEMGASCVLSLEGCSHH